jgi:predicted transcriptional regulator
MHDHIAKIVRAYLKGNAVPSAQLPALISQVGAFLYGLNQPIPTAAPTPAVPVRRSVLPDAVVCLDCGWQGKILRGHVRVAHWLFPEAYRERWGLKADHPLVAPGYSKRRSTLARSLGSGRRGANTKEASTGAEGEAGRVSHVSAQSNRQSPARAAAACRRARKIRRLTGTLHGRSAQ